MSDVEINIDYDMMVKKAAVQHAKDMIAQRGGVGGSEPIFDDTLGFVRFRFPLGDNVWVYPDGTEAAQHPDTEDGGLFESMTDDEQPVFLEIYRCHRFDDPMYGLFNADLILNDDFMEMQNPDAMRDFARSLMLVADRLDQMNMEVIKHWRNA